MILYTNGDSHTAAAECVNNYAFAEDDKRYTTMGRAPHPENLAQSWGKLLSSRLSCGFVCDAESASSNARIIRTTKQWIEKFDHELYRTFMVIQWSTWEREEWLIDDVLYQINASGTDDVPDSHKDQYKNYVSNVNWQQKTRDAHEEIWNFHQELESLGVKHVFFNGNNDFSKIEIQKDWGKCYIGPYDPASTYNAIVSKKCDTVSPISYHYGVDGHRVWAQYLTKYIVEHKLV